MLLCDSSKVKTIWLFTVEFNETEIMIHLQVCGLNRIFAIIYVGIEKFCVFWNQWSVMKQSVACSMSILYQRQPW